MSADRAADAAFDPTAAARRVAEQEGFVVALPADAAAQLARTLAALDRGEIVNPTRTAALAPRDLRHLPWSSIDNPESRDLDQVEVAEPLPDGATRLFVGLADVDLLVPQDTPLDRHAHANTTSLYAGAAVFPMLPEALSADRTSLVEGADRQAFVVELVVAADGTVGDADAYPALVRNHARLAYDEVGAWLDGRGPLPAAAARAPVIERQLRLHDAVAARLRARRERLGALEFETVEARPVIRDGAVVGFALARRDRARALIENVMIAANAAMARALESAGIPSIRRVVRAPERWDRLVRLAAAHGTVLPAAPDAPALAEFLRARRASDPAGFAELSLAVVKLLGPGEYVVERPGDARPNHFGLAVPDYAHGTAPNRRYADLVTQRLLVHRARSRVDPTAAPPYTEDALAAIAAHCTARENAARAVERTTRKQAAAALLAPQVGAAFDAVVTGVKGTGTFVRLVEPPVEGRLVDAPPRGDPKGPDVGDRVRVRLVATDPAQGFVDFVRGG